MNPRLALPIVASSLLVASVAHADPTSAQENAGAQTETGKRIILSALFPERPSPSPGPRRSLPASVDHLDAPVKAPDVLSWVSPVFVWIEPGYAYAETSVAF